MTKAAQHYGKKLDNFWYNEETKEYLRALAPALGIPSHSRELNDGIIQTYRGAKGGTWAHPKLAVFFARWLDVRFAVWCDLMVDEILRGRVEVQPVATPPTPDRTVEDIVKALLPALLPEVRCWVSLMP